MTDIDAAAAASPVLRTGADRVTLLSMDSGDPRASHHLPIVWG